MAFAALLADVHNLAIFVSAITTGEIINSIAIELIARSTNRTTAATAIPTETAAIFAITSVGKRL